MTEEQKLRNRAWKIMDIEKFDEPEIAATQLAEQAAWQMGHDEWLDDPDHWIWDVALVVRGEE